MGYQEVSSWHLLDMTAVVAQWHAALLWKAVLLKASHVAGNCLTRQLHEAAEHSCGAGKILHPPLSFSFSFAHVLPVPGAGHWAKVLWSASGHVKHGRRAGRSNWNCGDWIYSQKWYLG